MGIEYLSLQFHESQNKFRLYIHYLVDDGDLYTTKGDLIYEKREISTFLTYLTNIIANNINLAVSLRHQVGMYNFDSMKFIDDIQKLIEDISEDYDVNKKYLSYMDNYRQIIEKILYLEALSYLNHLVRIEISSQLLHAFDLYGDIILMNQQIYIHQLIEDNRLMCLKEGEEHSDMLLIIKIGDIPFSICESHFIEQNVYSQVFSEYKVIHSNTVK